VQNLANSMTLHKFAIAFHVGVDKEVLSCMWQPFNAKTDVDNQILISL
jgi:hypothetical protein